MRSMTSTRTSPYDNVSHYLSSDDTDDKEDTNQRMKWTAVSHAPESSKENSKPAPKTKELHMARAGANARRKSDVKETPVKTPHAFSTLHTTCLFDLKDHLNEVIEARQEGTKTFYHARVLEIVKDDENRDTSVKVRWVAADTTEILPIDYDHLKVLGTKRKRTLTYQQ